MGVTPTPDVRFTDITQSSKIDFKQENSAISNECLIETRGGGVPSWSTTTAVGWISSLRMGARIDDPLSGGELPDKSDRKYWNRLYHQNADGTFH
jgi:hypothetical protein